MKTFLKYLGGIFLLLLVGIGSLLAYVKLALPDVGAPPDLKVSVTPELVARGEYLAHHVCLCMDCHSTRDWTKFSGPLVDGTLGIGGEVFNQDFGFPGKFVSKNITPFGVANWTDGELFRAITCGVNKDGKALFPIMPYNYYGKMDESDIHALIAYIRSLSSQESHPEASVPDFPFNFIINTIPNKQTPQKRPDPSDVLAYGAYMINAAGCHECHTKQEKGQVVGEPFAGGFEFKLAPGIMVRSPNITPHETGLKNWTKEMFIQRFKQYTDSSYVLPSVDMDKGEFQTVMPWTMYAGMTEEDLGAIYEYLRTVKPVNSTIERWVSSK
jgi:mono/diheme cytochrome c family protein